MSTRLRTSALRALRGLGVRSFVTRSGLGHPFVCHLGDSLGENPYYNENAFRTELEVCAAWVRHGGGGVIFDIGANVGFWSTQIAQMVADPTLVVFAFEPVPLTFAKLAASVERLTLSDRIHVIATAVTDRAGLVRLTYVPYDSMLARLEPESERDADARTVYAPALTLDEFTASAGVHPVLLKIDVEGSEARALRGARRILTLPNRPGIMFEYNPGALARAGEEPASLAALVSGYQLHYVDDFEGQRRQLGDPVCRLADIDWVCNLFAVPSQETAQAQWRASLELARQRLEAVSH